MPAVTVQVTEQLLELATARAEQLGKSIDELYAEAIDRYIEVTKHASAGSLRSRNVMPRSSPQITIEIPEELFQRAEGHAERLEKRRDAMYAEALAKQVARSLPADSALNQGHDLPQRFLAPKRLRLNACPGLRSRSTLLRKNNARSDMTERDAPDERDVHHSLNQPASDPDPTEWPDPYDKRPDPRDPEADATEMEFGDVHTPTGATSTSEPHHEVDPEVDPRKANPHELRRGERRRAGGG